MRLIKYFILGFVLYLIHNMYCYESWPTAFLSGFKTLCCLLSCNTKHEVQIEGKKKLFLKEGFAGYCDKLKTNESKTTKINTIRSK